MDQQVGRYKIVGKLGKGAMGMVFLAEDPLLSRQVALKTIDLSVEEQAQRGFLLERLLRDARAAAALSHPHIVSVFDVVQEGDCAWLVMEYIPGETLAQRMAAGPLETGFALRILAEVAAALDYTHARGVIHRDIKPANIMIDPNGEAKIMDFGIARLSESRTTTPTGMVMGTVEYMAPEQIKGEPLDGRADQFALAAVAYQVVTGSTMFGPQTFTTLTYKLVNEAPPPPRSRNPNLPAGVDQVLARALSKQPAGRFVDCAGFISALAAAFSGTATLQAPTGRTPVEPAGSKKWLWAGIAAALFLAALAIGGFLIRQRQPATVQPVAAVQPPVAPKVDTPSPTTPPPPPGGQPPATAPAITRSAPATPPTAPKTVVTPPPAESHTSGESPTPTEPPPPIEPKPASHDAADHDVDKARQLIEAHDFSGAVAVLSQVIAAHPNNAQARELRGLANQELKLFQDAVQDYTADLGFNPGHTYALHQRGICYVQLKRDDLALADFNRTLELRPDFAVTYVNRGFLYSRRGAFNFAIADFTRAIALQPGNKNAYRGRMNARRQAGDAAGAEADEKKLAELRDR